MKEKIIETICIGILFLFFSLIYGIYCWSVEECYAEAKRKGQTEQFVSALSFGGGRLPLIFFRR